MDIRKVSSVGWSFIEQKQRRNEKNERLKPLENFATMRV